MKVLLLSLSLLLLNACVAERVKEKKKANLLESTLYNYATAIRWGYFDEAYSFRKYEKGEYPNPPKNLVDVRVTAYDVLHPPTLMVEDVAVQVVEIRYYFTDSQRVRNIRQKEIWIFDEAVQRWYLDTPIPEFN